MDYAASEIKYEEPDATKCVVMGAWRSLIAHPTLLTCALRTYDLSKGRTRNGTTTRVKNC